MSKNEALKDMNLYGFLKTKNYKKDWSARKISNHIIQKILNKSSKKGNGNHGEPDFVYVNEDKKILILIENKDSIKQHISKDGASNPTDFAVDGAKHYLSFFTNNELIKLDKITQKYLNGWKFVSIAVSGDISDEYNHLISSFIIQDETIKDIETKEILDENDYISLFENINTEQLAKEISESSRKINSILRSLDSQKRPVLLSGLMISLFEPEEGKNDFKAGYINWNTETIVKNIPNTVESILKKEGVPDDKIQVLINELSFIKTDKDINDTEILKQILEELDKNVIPLFAQKSHYDIIGKFYEEFLRYAGVTNVKKGIVLTPSHITKLFTELVPIKTDDVFFDPCCGTGAFLISAMNKICSEIDDSSISNKSQRKKDIKQKQLIGFEKNTTMYSLSISNMLFRGDGKSKIFNLDYFSPEANEVLKELRTSGVNPTIGFINPPYGGADNKDNPTKKEIQFLERLLSQVSRYGVMIAPLSSYFKDDINRNRILSKHTLKYVINMPKELFQPNAAAHTAIAVFETNTPHNNKEVIMYNLQDDGFVLSKNKGRTDALNKWGTIKNDLIKKINKPEEFIDNINLLTTKISNNDEWIIQAHSQTDYSLLSEKFFSKSIKDYTVFSTKLKLDLLDKDIDEITLLEILNENNIKANSILEENGKN